MPGKYSHSVILADYSSRGIISLPPDQYSKYLESAPLTQKASVSQLRVRGTQSALGLHHDPPGRSPGWSSRSDQRTVTSGRPPAPPKDQLDVIVDANDTNEFQPMRYSRYYEQMPKSSPEIGVATHAAQSASSTTYQRQLHPNSNIESMPSQPKSADQTSHGRQIPKEKPRRDGSAVRDAKANDSARKASATTGRSSSNQALSVGVNNGHLKASTSPRLSDKPSSSNADLSTPATPRKPHSAGGNSASQMQPSVKSTSNEDRSRQSKGKQISSEHTSNNTKPAGSRTDQKDATLHVNMTPVRSPRSPILDEPDFDGFSDMDPAPSGYFDYRKKPFEHSRSSSLSSPLPIQRPDSSDRPASRGQQSNRTEMATPKATAIIQNGDADSPSQTTESSMKTSTKARTSDSSASSVSVSNGHPIPGVPRHSFEGARKHNQVSKTDQPWRLPEISEDHGFSPSIFEDKEGQLGRIDLEGSDSRPTIGHISSGKDISFDNSDAVSELSAALPPPITRFRDEEDEFNANMAKLFGEGGDYAVNKKGTHSIGRSATKKTKGFFSKFRSRSTPPSKLGFKD